MTFPLQIRVFIVKRNHFCLYILAPLSSTQVPSRPNVAFSARMSQPETGLTNHHTLVFDDVQTNVGGGYNQHSGSFVAPDTGVYVFSWTLYYYHPSSICVDIVINGAVFGNSFGEGSSSYLVSTSVIVVHLNNGDTVLVRTNKDGCHNTGNILSDQYRWSTFSGWLLF